MLTGVLLADDEAFLSMKAHLHLHQKMITVHQVAQAVR